MFHRLSNLYLLNSVEFTNAFLRQNKHFYECIDYWIENKNYIRCIGWVSDVVISSEIMHEKKRIVSIKLQALHGKWKFKNLKQLCKLALIGRHLHIRSRKKVYKFAVTKIYIYCYCEECRNNMPVTQSIDAVFFCHLHFCKINTS